MPEYTPDYMPQHRIYDRDRAQEELSEDLTKKMIRRPTEEDFEDVLSPEGDSEDIVGSDISDGTYPSDSSVAGTG